MFLRTILLIPLIFVVVQTNGRDPTCNGKCVHISDCPSLKTVWNLQMCKGNRKVCCPNPTEPAYNTRSEIACLNYANDNLLCPDHPLIREGKKANKNEFQYMASIGMQNSTLDNIRWICGGTLIHRKYVLTAAHCILFERPPDSEVPDFYVSLGAHNRSDGIIYSVVNQYFYENRSNQDNTHDISILELNDNVIFNEKIKPACLPNNNVKVGDIFTVSGWGEDNSTSTQSRQLIKTQLRILKTSECTNGQPDTQICGVGVKENSNACEGDSGGPMARWHLTWGSCLGQVVGIVSTGDSCDADNAHILYTNVLTYLDWIEDIVWPEN